jgi:ATP-dependent DNA helicase RecG
VLFENANRLHFRQEVLQPLLERGILIATIPDKPTSPKQKYKTQ